MGLGSSRWLAKLATEHCKPDGFQEVPEDKEREFLRDVPIQKLAGIAERRARSLRALGVWTLGDVAQLPLGLLEKRYGFFGLELWLLANGQLRERLSLANKPRTCIGSATTLPYDEPDYESALLFLLDQTERVVTTFFRENLKAREMGVYVRFKDMIGPRRERQVPRRAIRAARHQSAGGTTLLATRRVRDAADPSGLHSFLEHAAARSATETVWRRQRIQAARTPPRAGGNRGALRTP